MGVGMGEDVVAQMCAQLRNVHSNTVHVCAHNSCLQMLCCLGVVVGVGIGVCVCVCVCVCVWIRCECGCGCG